MWTRSQEIISAHPFSSQQGIRACLPPTSSSLGLIHGEIPVWYMKKCYGKSAGWRLKLTSLLDCHMDSGGCSQQRVSRWNFGRNLMKVCSGSSTSVDDFWYRIIQAVGGGSNLKTIWWSAVHLYSDNFYVLVCCGIPSKVATAKASPATILGYSSSQSYAGPHVHHAQ